MAAAETSTKKSRRIKLRSSDLVCYEVKKDVASMSDVLKEWMEDRTSDPPVRDVEVSSKIMNMVLKYCKYHSRRDRPDYLGLQVPPSARIAAWDAEFVHLDWPTLFDLFRAADSLKIPKLRNLTTQRIGHAIFTMPADEIRRSFIIPEFNTPEEEAKIRRGLGWIFGI